MCDAGQPAVDGDPYAEFASAVELFVSRTSGEASVLDVEDTLWRKQRFIDLLQLDFARHAARAVANEAWERLGSTSPVGWLTNSCHMTPGNAGAAICVGEHADQLERSIASMRRGVIGFAHLALIARTQAAVEGSGATLDEARLLRRAEAQTPHQFRKTCAHARHAADADAFRRMERDSAELRFLSFYTVAHDEEGVWLRGRFDKVGAATLRAALEPLARRLGPDDHRPHDRRWADATLEMATYTLDTGLQGRGRQVTHLQVTTTLETLMGVLGAPGGQLEGTVISSATVQRLACSANVRRILMGPDSLVADVGRARRLPATATRIKVEQRDRGCVWPRCGRPVRWTTPHHVAHWGRDNGDTDDENLVLLCWKHHEDTHLRGWQVVRVEGEREVLVIPPLPDPDPRNRGPSYADVA